MKIRSGFVSNSSSSSFCIYGVCIDSWNKLKDAYQNLTGNMVNDDGDGYYDICDTIQNRTGLFYEIDYGSEYFYFGQQYTNQPDDKTFGQFKEETNNKIKEVFGEDVKASHIEEEIYN
jgi:hypothetical protein